MRAFGANRFQPNFQNRKRDLPQFSGVLTRRISLTWDTLWYFI